MPPFFGSSQKSTTNTQENSTSNTASTSRQTSVTTPNVAPWLQAPFQAVADRATSLLSLDPYDRVAPAQPLQQRAANLAAGLSGSPWNIDGAADLTRGAANTSWLDPYMNAPTPSAGAGRAADYVDDYLNP